MGKHSTPATKPMTRDDLEVALLHLCQEAGLTTEATDEKIEELLDTIVYDEDEVEDEDDTPANEASDGEVKYPKIKVQLTGARGPGNHPFAIIKAVIDGMRAAKVPHAEHEVFRAEALSGDYNHVIATAMRWVNVS